ncbi:EAL domain-containing protein [Kineococcus gynurae]|uniref:EAL domain-containing protein n=1 Tax=Kineococcus gynurae TaxID=452979 RepID=A0ABV5LSI4_9ACTN
MQSADERRPGASRRSGGTPVHWRTLPGPLALAAAALVLLASIGFHEHHQHDGVPLRLALPGALLVVAAILFTLLQRAEAGRDRQLHDPLTQVLNRAGLLASGSPLGVGGDEALTVVAVVKFDDLRQMRLTLGTDAADSLLVIAARRLTEVPQARVARIDSDALAVVITDTCAGAVSPTDIAAGVGEAVRFLLVDPISVSDGGLLVRPETSVGVAWAGEHGDDLAALLAAADLATITAAGSTGRVALAERGDADTDRDALALQAELPGAIERGELRVFFQPLLDAHHGRLVGAEALVRWQHPERGLLGPGAFVPLAERSTTIVALTRWVLAAAVAQCAAWHEDGLPIGVSVNLSAAMLAESDLVESVEDLLLAYDLPPSTLTLEVTESSLVEDPDRARDVLRALRAAGTKVSIDDFGTGYTSLTLLRQLQVDELKIDRSFVAAAADTPADAAIVRALVDLAHRMSMEVVAEGVEDERTSRLVVRLGVDVLQGFHYARPVPAEQFPGLAGTPVHPASALSGPVSREEAARLTAGLRMGDVFSDSRVFLEQVCALAGAVSGRPVAVVARVEADVVRELAAFPHRTEASTCSRERSICSWVVGTNQLLDVPDLSTDPRHVLAPGTAGPVRAAACFPVRDPQGRAVAVLGVYSPEAGGLDARRRLILSGLADLLSEHLAGADSARIVRRMQAALVDAGTPVPAREETGTARVHLAARLAALSATLLGAEGVVVAEADPPHRWTDPGSGWHKLACWGTAPATDRVLLDVGGEVLDAVRRSGRPLWIPDVSASPHVSAELADRLGDAGLLLLPVGVPGRRPWVLAARWSPGLEILAPALRETARGLCLSLGEAMAALEVPAAPPVTGRAGSDAGSDALPAQASRADRVPVRTLPQGLPA